MCCDSGTLLSQLLAHRCFDMGMVSGVQGQELNPSLKLPLRGWGLIDLPLRLSNEHLLSVRVPRAKKIISPHPSPLLEHNHLNMPLDSGWH